MGKSKRWSKEKKLALVIVLSAAILVSSIMIRDANITGRSVEEPVNLAPIYIGPTSFVVDSDGQINIDLNAFFTDTENDELTFLVTQEINLDIVLDDSLLTITPEPGFVGERTLTLVASDGTNVLRRFVKLTVEGNLEGTFSTGIPGPSSTESLTSTVEETVIIEVPIEEPTEDSGFGSQGFQTEALFPVHNITQCGIINFSSRLTSDISSNGTCITFNNSDIFLDCAGFSITYGIAGEDNRTGVNVTDHNNATIQNCIIRKGNITDGSRSYGIGLFNTTNSTVIDNDINTNGSATTEENDGIHTGTSSESEIVLGDAILVTNDGNVNQPYCTGHEQIDSCKVCFTTGGVDCTALGLKFCTDGEGFKTDTLVEFTTELPPTEGTIQVIGGEVVRCYINDLSNTLLFFGTRNNCGTFVSASFNESFFANPGAQNNLTCQVSGSGEEEDNGFKLVSFSYVVGTELFTTSSNSSNVRITNNNITAIGGINTRGIFLDAHNSNISYNNISTTAGNDSHGIFSTADNVSVIENNITTFQGIKSRGILVQGANNNVTLNIFVTNGSLSSEGIAVHAKNANVTQNIVSTFGENGSHGIVLRRNNATIRNNNISVNSPLSHGMFFDSAATDGSIHNNTIITTGTGSDGMHLLGASGNTFFNNTIINATRAGIHLERALNNIFNMTTIPLVNTSLFISEDHATINFTEVIIITNETNFTSIVNITYNSTRVDTNNSVGQQFNLSAVLRFFNIDAQGVRPVVDPQDDETFENCGFCTDKDYNDTSRILEFKVPSFTTYAGAAVSDCTTLDLGFNQSSVEYDLFNLILTNSSASCIRIVGDNLTLDCQGFAIGGNAAGTGINITFARNITLKHCRIENFTNNIEIDRTNYSLFWNNTARNSSEISVEMFLSNHNLFRNNTFEVTNPFFDEAMDVTGTCYNNTFYNNTFLAISWDAWSIDSCHNNTLVNNTAVSNGSTGIEITNSQNNTLIDNHGVGNGPFGDLGIEVRGLTNSWTGNNTLIRNNGTGRANAGIKLEDSPYSIMIENIGLSVNDPGISIIDSNNSLISYNNGTSHSGHGIRIFRSQFTNLTNNNGTSNTSHGIIFYQHDNGVSFVQSPNSTVINNTGRSMTSGDGFRVEGTSNSLFVDNNGTSDSGRGIYIFGAQTLGQSATYIIEAYNGEWIGITSEHFDKQDNINYRYAIKNITLPFGTTKVRITQQGTDTAHIDMILLDDQVPIELFDYQINQSLSVSKVQATDYDVINSVARTIEVTWASSGSTLTIGAIEEDAGGAPDFWPRTGFNEYIIGTTQPNTYYFTPYSAHPSGWVYLDFTTSGSDMLVRLDYTPDNTFDYDGDYARLHIQTPEGGIKKFYLNNTDTTWGTAAFEYTDKADYQYKTYNFTIPLSEMNASDGDAIGYQLEYYGTSSEAQPCDNNTYVNNKGLSNTSEGIRIDTCTNSTFVNNTGQSNTASGIRIDDITFFFDHGDNLFANNTGVSNSSYGIWVNNATFNVFRNNKALSNYSYGLFVNSSSDHHFYNNSATSLYSSGIVFARTTYATFSSDTARSLNNGTAWVILLSEIFNVSNSTATSPNGTALHLIASQLAEFNNNEFSSGESIALNLVSYEANITDGFEDGTLAPFITSGQEPLGNWSVNDSNPFAGTFAAKAGNITRSNETNIYINISYPPGGGIIKFTREVNASTAGELEFFIDSSQLQNFQSGQRDYATFRFEVAEGAHLFNWSYVKSSSSSVSGLDTAFIDEIITRAATTDNTFTNTTLRTNNSWIFTDRSTPGNNFSGLTIEEDNGSIYIHNVTVPNSTNASKNRLNVTFNLAFINSTNLTAFNTTAEITFKAITFTDPQPIVDFDDDSSFENCTTTICNEISFTNNVFVYNVTQFTGYSSNETLNDSGEEEAPEESPEPATGGGGSGGRPGIIIRYPDDAKEELAGGCFESWVCEGWSECEDNRQTRVCVDLGSCNTTELIPITERACLIPEVEKPAPTVETKLPVVIPQISSPDIENFPLSLIIFITLLSILFILLFAYKRSRKKDKN